MRNKKIVYLFSLLTLLISCQNSKSNSSDEVESDYKNEDSSYEEDSWADVNGFEDGTYVATVDYYNPNTDYSATYTLDVEVQDNQVVTIYFPNDGYLDDDHIWPDELDENGFVSIEGDDGKTYDIQIDH
jgi:hypothetical protein